MRRGPERLQANAPPRVRWPATASGRPNSAPKSGGSKASICPASASAASISSMGVAAPAVRNSSLGWYSRIPARRDKSSRRGSWRGRPNPRFDPPATTSRGSSTASASPIASRNSSRSAGAKRLIGPNCFKNAADPGTEADRHGHEDDRARRSDAAVERPCPG